MGRGCIGYLGAVVVNQLKQIWSKPRSPHQGQDEESPLISDRTTLPKSSPVSGKDVREVGSLNTGLRPSLSISGFRQDARGLDAHSGTPVEPLGASSDRNLPRQSISATSTLNSTPPQAGRPDNADPSNNCNTDSTENLSDESLPSDSRLRDKLCKARIEWPEHSFRYFIAVDDLNRIVTPVSISVELERCKMTFLNDELREHTVKAIWKSAPKLFAILVCLKRGNLITDFLDEEIDDTDLPFVRSDNTARSGHFKLCSKKTPDQPIKCMTSWDQARVNDFGRDQWCMLAPIFEYTDEIEHYDLEDNCVLPWVEDEERSDQAIEGGFGSVWKIAIHPAHQQIRGSVSPRQPYRFVALKRLHLSDKPSFNSEVEMLKLLGRREHTHLVSLLATFRLKKQYYLLFPYADSNLREYWKRTPLPDFSEVTVLWTLSQCKAMASALHNVHEYRSTHHPSSQAPLPSDAGSSDTSEDEERLYGRHGDLKAENILWFLDEARNERGHLVIADFGLTDFHKMATRSDVNPGYINGTPSYEGPEMMLHSKISRAFDIWSLGCLYLEFVTWLVCGWEHLERFPDARRRLCGPEMIDDTFFTIVDGEHRTAVVRQSVKDWINDLHEMPRCSAFVHDFLNLISERLLVVETHDRARIAQLNTDLARMKQKGEKRSSYLTAPIPTPPRLQTNLHPLSLAAVVQNDASKAPGPNEGTPLPARSSMSSTTEVSWPQAQPLSSISAPSTSPPNV